MNFGVSTDRRTWTLLAWLAAVTVCSADEDLFEQRVAPILQRRCLSCHNDEQHKGEFSLQSASALEADYIVRGNAADSPLIEVVTPIEGSARMPKDADPLKQEEIAILREWIDAGANWPEGFVLSESKVTDFDWWSYRPLVQPEPPSIDDNWIRTPIDAFILERQRSLDLMHSDDADRRTLIRRLTYDLIGLPPTPEEVRSFARDPDPLAYEKLVDRLLDSQHYGERWARHWLDVVKYADTCGYDKDKLRPNAWPYRDYVIRSFNEDKPYAKFVQEQIAGDVLFPGEPDGYLGLGFLAAGPWDFIGHVEVPEAKLDGQEARNLDRDDMVSNVLNTFCSVTVQCARCHNHKFDPVTQEHYYGLQAVFAAVDRAERAYDLDPDVQNRRRELEEVLSRLKRELEDVQREIADAGGPELVTLTRELAELQAQLKIEKEPEYGYHSAIEPTDDVAKWVEIELNQPARAVEIVLHACHDDFAGIGSGFGFPPSYKVDVETADGEWRNVVDQSLVSLPNPGLNPLTSNGPDVPVRRLRITATKLAPRQNDFIFALAEVEVFDENRRNVALNANVTSLDSIEAPVRWSRQNLTDGRWAQGGSAEQLERIADVRNRRQELAATAQTPERLARRQKLNGEIEARSTQLKSLPTGKMVYAASTHFPEQGNFKPTSGKPRDVRILHRGDIRQPLESATPGALPLSDALDWRFADNLDEGQRRAALAHWLTNRDNPLVWRSIVNRVWQYHFGTGIVASPNDFGRMGQQPTHPELLDWLAVEFRDGGQSLKKLHRLIVTSSVYRQSSTFHAANAAIDGSNQYLWSMPRRRLEAEEIRDSILAVSGALNPQMGGPGFYLFELERPEHSPHYEYHKFDPSDPASHRRSIYRFVVRSQPDPWMSTLDCADSSQSTPKRNETLTSLQALSLLNNRFNLVMAERFAERLKQQNIDVPQQIDLAMQLIVQRAPTAEESRELIQYAEQHGLPNTCRLLFNLSEFVFVD